MYERELLKWIEDEWLLPYDEEKYGPVMGLIPLMAVTQHSKNKVRRIYGFQGTNVAVVDLAKAYLQIRI